MTYEIEAKKIVEMIIDYWYDRILNKMATAPFPNFDEALEEVRQEIVKDD